MNNSIMKIKKEFQINNKNPPIRNLDLAALN